MCILGLSFRSTKSGISSNCNKIWLKAQSRKISFNGIISKTKVTDINDECKWMVPKKISPEKYCKDPQSISESKRLKMGLIVDFLVSFIVPGGAQQWFIHE